jgi:hypothetical protein
MSFAGAARSVEVTTPREGGDVTGSEVKSRNKRRIHYTIVIK